MKQLIDTDTINLCKKGDKHAFQLVVQAYQRMLFSLALKMLGDEEDAKDVVQESFIKAWLNIRQYDERRDFTTWMYTISSRLCLDRLKRKRWLHPLPEDEKVLQKLTSSASPQHQLENKEYVSIVRIMAQGLSEKQRLVFTLSILEGFGAKEVMEITGLDSTQVKSNLCIAKKTIREQLKKFGYE